MCSQLNYMCIDDTSLWKSLIRPDFGQKNRSSIFYISLFECIYSAVGYE